MKDHKLILLWKYWVVREAFVRIFKKYFNTGEDSERQTENFIRTYLENSDETYEDIRYNTLAYKFSEGCYIYSFSFGARYLYQAGNCGIDTWSDGQGVNEVMLHYP